MTYLAELVRVKIISVVPRGTREGEIFSDVYLQKNLATVSQDSQSLTRRRRHLNSGAGRAQTPV